MTPDDGHIARVPSAVAINSGSWSVLANDNRLNHLADVIFMPNMIKHYACESPLRDSDCR